MNITKASSQWATRPADQRFWTVSDMHQTTKHYREACRTATVDHADLRVEAIDGDIRLIGKTGVPAELSHFAFGQLSGRADAPASYLRSLPATLAAQNLNHGLKAHQDGDATARLLVQQNGGYFIRAVTSEKYTRIWNSDITERLLGMEAQGWRVPPARPANVNDSDTRIATAQDAALSLTVQPGDVIGPAGLYASNEDMFAFMLHPEKVIRDGSEGGLVRGFLVWNSEVGKSTFGVMTFYFRGACGNHIIWDASEVKEIRLRHVGNADERAFQGLEVELNKYANESATEVEAKIEASKRFVLKSTKVEDVIDMIFGAKILTRTDAAKAYDAVIPEIDGAPYTAYGFAQGITRMSQESAFADKRVALDRAAGKVLEMAF